MPKSQQIAALPWRMGEQGVEILLVTTRTTKRWLIPKGWTMDGKADHEAAEIEAYEEAGVMGVANITSIGNYGYIKLSDSGKPRHLNVRVYALEVKRVLGEWPERSERERIWVSPQQALTMIGEPELLPVIAAFHAPKSEAMPLPEGGFMNTLRGWLSRIFR